jgi:hypothetical protein
MYVPYPPKRPEEQTPNPPKLDMPPDYKEMEQEIPRARILLSPFNLETERHRRQQIRNIYSAILVIAVIVTLGIALWLSR